MESFTALWSKTPRWARGLILGNLCYFAIAGCGLILMIPNGDYIDLAGFEIIFIPFLGITTDSYLLPIAFVYYGVWCACSALFVQWLGEGTGMIMLFISMVVLGIVVIIYAFANFSFSI
jgi:hypothetical protein